MLHPSSDESGAPILDVELWVVSITLKGMSILSYWTVEYFVGVSEMVCQRQKRFESGREIVLSDRKGTAPY